MSGAHNVIDIPVKGSDEVVTIDCSDLPIDPRDFCAILSAEDADSRYWIRLAWEYRGLDRIDQALDILQDGLQSRAVQSQGIQRHYLHSMLAALCLHKSRHAATGMGKQIDSSNDETKEYWHKKALQSINEAARLKPLTTSNTLMRGVLSILGSDKDRSYEDANKQFDNALRENSANTFAMLGKARILYARKNFKLALVYYQKVLRLRSTIVPDPRIGIGLCYWHLDMKDDAEAAWERANELDPTNAVILVLLGLYSIAKAFENVSEESIFESAYSRGLKFVSEAYKSEPLPLAGVALASYMFSRKKMDSLHRTMQKVLITAEAPALRADALFWLGRGQHLADSYDQAAAFYNLAKQTEPDSLVVSVAIGQMQIAREDLTDAKLTFESILEKHPRCIEALSILGSIYAQEALDPSFKGDKLTHNIKAKACLDKAIALTSEHKQRNLTDAHLHFTRAMLADDDVYSTRIKILEQAADLQAEFEDATSAEILNNMAVVHYHEGSFEAARELYHKAIDQCMETAKNNPAADANNLITTITYNLGRCEEQAGEVMAAREIYTQLTQRYPDYVEPAARLAYLDYGKQGLESVMSRVSELLEIDPSNIEVRALYGWLLNKQKKSKSLNYNEDPERKHFNHTLKHIDNYERYSLVSLGNFYIKLARETRADSPAGASERHKHYDMSIKFFERALHYDARNAYAAQGLAIAFAEHKQYQKAINIFGKVRETLRDESIFINMGHCLCELHQYSRAIENYETALTTYHADGKDLNLFLCLGRAWLSRGREEKNAGHLREALKYAKMALALDPANTTVIFNVAFVQFQFAEILRNTTELKRTVLDLEEASTELEAAIQSFIALADHKQSPYPKSDILQRATMGRNTTTKQIERAIQQQGEYESKNSAKVAEARAKREEEQAARDAAQQALREAEKSKQEALLQKRKEMQEQARSWADKRHKEEQEQAELEEEKAAAKKEKKSRSKKQKDADDSDEQPDGEAKPKKTRKRKSTKKQKKGRIGSDSESEKEAVATGSEEKEENGASNEKATKKRKLSSKKYISKEFIDSDDEDDLMPDVVEDDANEGDAMDAGGQDYANERMTSDRERGEPEDNAPNETSSNVNAVPIEDSHAPVTNQPDSNGASVLATNGLSNGDTLAAEEAPGISAAGEEVE